MIFQEALNDAVGVIAETFGQECTYVYSEGVEAPIQAVFREHDTSVQAGLNIGATVARPTLYVRESVLTRKPVEADKVRIDGKSYWIANSERDDAGGLLLTLRLAK